MYEDFARSWINLGRFWKGVEIILMGMIELGRTCQIVRRCDTLCVLEGDIIYNARNKFGSNKRKRNFSHPGDLGRGSNEECHFFYQHLIWRRIYHPVSSGE